MHLGNNFHCLEQKSHAKVRALNQHNKHQKSTPSCLSRLPHGPSGQNPNRYFTKAQIGLGFLRPAGREGYERLYEKVEFQLCIYLFAEVCMTFMKDKCQKKLFKKIKSI